MRKLEILVCVLIHAGMARVSAQELILAGKIRDTNTRQEIAGVNIYVKDTQIGTSSNSYGQFSLRIENPHPEMIIVFKHISYEPLELAIDKVRKMDIIYLQPRIIPLRQLEVEARGKPVEINKDLPQPLSIFEAKSFDVQGFADAGDLLRVDHSVQVQEQLDGRKTVAIRGGNPDEVVVLYNGVRLNSSYDNVFDFSLVDVEDVDRFEIIKGSNSVLYGSGAFSGVINIVPKLQPSYRIRFQQRVGTYDSGNWGLHMYEKWKGLRGSFSLRRGAFKRRFLGDIGSSPQIVNTSSHETSNLAYNFSQDSRGRPKNILSASYIHSVLDYENERDGEQLRNSNQVVLLKYGGDILRLRSLSLSLSRHKMSRSQDIFATTYTLRRKLQDETTQLNLEKRCAFTNAELLFAYQAQKAELNFQDQRSDLDSTFPGLESATFSRRRQGLVSIMKFSTPSTSDVVKTTDLHFSVRLDKVHDTERNPVVRSSDQVTVTAQDLGIFRKHTWKEPMMKLSTIITGHNNTVDFDIYMNYGRNIKFPTLSQQISSPYTLETGETRPTLNPERNISLEFGGLLTGKQSKTPRIHGFQLSANLFRNNYENKFRVTYPLGIPVAFFDNVPFAKLSGFEAESRLFLFRKKVTFEVGFARYFISDKTAFPFKSEKKLTSSFIVDYAGYSFRLHWFRESEQIGRIQRITGEFSEIVLPVHVDLDIHLRKDFELGKAKILVNISARNVLNNDSTLEGLVLWDRRIYLTLGMQY